MWSKKSIIFFSLFFLIGCQKKEIDHSKLSPKQVLEGYINKSFNVSTEREKEELLQYLTGDAHARLKAWSQEQFLSAFVDTKRKLIKLKLKDIRSPSANEVNITYELIFRNQENQKNPVLITHKKICLLVRQDGKWLIQQVKNLKELIEFEGELSLP